MDDPNTVIDSGIHFIQCDDVFRVMILYLHEIADLPVGIFGELNVHLNYILTEYCLLQMNPYSPCSWFIDGDFYSMVIYLLSFAIY